MQFNFNVNEVLKSALVMIDSTTKLGYISLDSNVNAKKSLSNEDKLSLIIDQMGKASAMAQSLPRPITTSSKLRHTDHRVYLLKVDDGNNGEVVGLLKVGYKTLFLYDIQSKQNEVRPLCVLDFYVHESKQRQGYGRKLFDLMLQSENVQPRHIAIDRPSPKFLFFLAKHYQMTDKITQLNNFVIFVDFFNGRSDTAGTHHNQRQHRPFIQTPSATTPSRLSPVKVTTTSTITSTFSTEPIRRRLPSSANKERVQPIVDDLSLHMIHPGPDVVVPPLLPRNGVPHSYKSMMTPTHRVGSADNVTNNNSHSSLPTISKRGQDKSPSSTPYYATQNLAIQHQNKGQDCSRSRRDYNYSVGLARHYSHTRLW